MLSVPGKDEVGEAGEGTASRLPAPPAPLIALGRLLCWGRRRGRGCGERKGRRSKREFCRLDRTPGPALGYRSAV